MLRKEYRASSALYTWGRAKNYRLGRRGTRDDSCQPELIKVFENCAIQQVACGGGHTLVLLEDGCLHSFGYNQYGQLGNGTKVDSPLDASRDISSLSNKLIAVACGRYHSAALDVNGTVFTWGGGKNGRLGHNDEQTRTIPCRITHLPRAHKIFCGYHITAAITDDGLYTWGWGEHGQLGQGSLEDSYGPKKVIFDDANLAISQLACGDRHCLVRTESGDVYTWGSNEFGQLGIGRYNEIYSSPVLLTSLAGMMVTFVAAGDRHSAAVTNTGSLFTWGCGAEGQCGHGDYNDCDMPFLVESLVGVFILKVFCGHNFTVALSKDNDIYVFGNNSYGQLGDGSKSSCCTPRKLFFSIPGTIDITCGHFHCTLWTTLEEQNEENHVEIRSRTESVDSCTTSSSTGISDEERRLKERISSLNGKLTDLVSMNERVIHENLVRLQEQLKKDRNETLEGILCD
ncbi:Probable E3 ubiquitin-protein ligase HERC1 [Galdieria sulphuraria]|uniref:E3 ubiquitin-protein ligase HERC1 n=1 Tax=Galdieria sulphuraria TaxID=130081 RepID=M2X0W9_GALSU|nr:E3 ubiquitin-protein ligase HERC1 [Galdieria sulphuraria]EME30000.1 E3 ubiquitin-protein ligase HERC1 [Galdieria sulphuraria]GJD06211.1 Probable E3 ubiquitin-protein ligase HERC1 [Galdieria sulphuraria]|eukprot:XP_005706520.1 E3 ubiquitin-protein ligase HERC1 [Galdieria sulphuraria]